MCVKNFYFNFFNIRHDRHGPLIAALVDSVKLLLKILVLLKSFQISNGIHDYI